MGEFSFPRLITNCMELNPKSVCDLMTVRTSCKREPLFIRELQVGSRYVLTVILLLFLSFGPFVSYILMGPKVLFQEKKEEFMDPKAELCIIFSFITSLAFFFISSC